MLVRTRFVPVAVSLAFGLAAAVLWPGCAYSPGDYCLDRCDCVGCNDLQLDACIDDAQDLYDNAAKAGCQSEANDYLSCLGREGTCRAGFYDADGCEYEYRQADTCVEGGGGGSGGGTPTSSSSTTTSTATTTTTSSGMTTSSSGGGGMGGTGGGMGGTGGGMGGTGGGDPPPTASCDAPDVAPSNGACVTLGPKVQCNPVTNEPCGDSGLICGWSGNFYQCYSTVPPNAVCEPCASDICAGGTLCPDDFDGWTLTQCAKACCDDGDCSGGACVKDGIAIPGAPIGVCLTASA